MIRIASRSSHVLRRFVCSAAFLAAPAVLGWTAARANPPPLRIGGTGAGLGGLRLLAETLAASGSAPAVRIVPNLGTIGGIRAVAAGVIDVAVASRPLTPAEQATGLKDQRYATTPVVFATHLDTATEDLTPDQAVSLIGGTIAAWPNGTPVRLSRRPNQDSDTVILAGLSPAMADAVAALQRRPGMASAASDYDQATALETVHGSFGVIALSLVRSEQRPLRVLRLAGQSPDAPGWPMQKALHIVSRNEPPTAVQTFLDQVFGPDALAVLAPNGHVMAARG